MNKTKGSMWKLLTMAFVIILVSFTAVIVADDDLKWYEKEKPSDTISQQNKDKLILEDKFVWNSSSYWKEGNCYYYDLLIGNGSHIRWQDLRRELKCQTDFSTEFNLTTTEIETLQIADVTWTLQQLGDVPVVQEVVKTASEKGENFKESKIRDKGIIIDGK
jgi:hypothetical protein